MTDIKKWDLLRTKKSIQFYKVVGFWGSDVVLAPDAKEDDQVLVYSKSELEELINDGVFLKVKRAE